MSHRIIQRISPSHKPISSSCGDSLQDIQISKRSCLVSDFLKSDKNEGVPVDETMSLKNHQAHGETTRWKEISIEGNELVCYEYEEDLDKPKCWLDGSQYRFRKSLISVQRIGGKSMWEILNF